MKNSLIFGFSLVLATQFVGSPSFAVDADSPNGFRQVLQDRLELSPNDRGCTSKTKIYAGESDIGLDCADSGQHLDFSVGVGGRDRIAVVVFNNAMGNLGFRNPQCETSETTEFLRSVLVIECRYKR